MKNYLISKTLNKASQVATKNVARDFCSAALHKSPCWRRYANVIMKKSIILSLFFIQGCTSNLYVETSSQLSHQLSDLSSIVVFVTNPHHDGYEVLKASGLYEISAEENVSKHLTLESSEIIPRCGNPLLASVFTLGLLPVQLDASEGFRYSIAESGVSTSYIHYLGMYERLSVWEWLAKPFSSREKTKIEALKQSSRKIY